MKRFALFLTLLALASCRSPSSGPMPGDYRPGQYLPVNPVQGDVVYYNGTSWVNLAPGTSGQVLQTAGASANPSWVTSTGLPSSPAQGDIAYYNGTVWANLAPGTNGQFLQTAGASANPLWATNTGLPSSPVQGDIAYYNGTAWANLAPGTSGQFLQTAGSSANPLWATASGGGANTPSPTRVVLKQSPVHEIENVVGAGIGSGNETSGTEFFVTQGGVTFTGNVFYAPSHASLTYKCSLWSGSSRRASGTLTITSSGQVAYCPFSSNYTTALADIGTNMWSTIWETSGTFYIAASATQVPNQPTSSLVSYGAEYLKWISWKQYASGDAVPSTNAASEQYPVEPVMISNTYTTSSSYTQPAFGSAVTIAISGGSTSNLFFGQAVYVNGCGIYKVLSITGATSFSALNIGDSINSIASSATCATSATVLLY